MPHIIVSIGISQVYHRLPIHADQPTMHARNRFSAADFQAQLCQHSW